MATSGANSSEDSTSRKRRRTGKSVRSNVPPKGPPNERKEYTRNRPEEWGESFLQDYAKHGSITKAAAVAGVARDTVYKRRSEVPEFREAMEIAREYYREWLKEEIDRRAVSGTLEETVRVQEDADGNTLTTITRTNRVSDTMLIFHAKAMMPEIYGDRLRVEQIRVDDVITDIATDRHLPVDIVALNVERIARQQMEKLGRKAAK